ncbi:MAG: class B sortase [Lachnospiraceae bacterium]
MGNVYRIGKFRFYSEEEYREGLKDVEKIRYISKELDLEDPQTVAHLYKSIRQGKIQFYTEIGDDYLLYLSDIVADNTEKLVEQQKKKRENEKEERKEKREQRKLLKETGDIAPSKWSLRNIVGLCCLCIGVVSFAMFAYSEYKEYSTTRGLKQLQNLRDANRTQEPSEEKTKKNEKSGSDLKKNADNNRESTDHQEETEMVSQPLLKKEDLTVLPEYQAIAQENEEFCGWLTVEGSDIDYPVMQSKDSDTFYLDHDFNGVEDANGSLFLEKDSDYINRDTNLTIYGHNMKSGLMFGELKRYLKEGYLEEHKQVRFDTLYEKGTYEIVAVCLAKVEYQDDTAFKYYNVKKLDSKNAFQTYLSNIQKLSVFNKKIDIAYGDQLLTLSTCNSYTEDGRLFLVAKKTG